MRKAIIILTMLLLTSAYAENKIDCVEGTIERSHDWSSTPYWLVDAKCSKGQNAVDCGTCVHFELYGANSHNLKGIDSRTFDMNDFYKAPLPTLLNSGYIEKLIGSEKYLGKKVMICPSNNAGSIYSYRGGCDIFMTENDKGIDLIFKGYFFEWNNNGQFQVVNPGVPVRLTKEIFLKE